MKVKGSGMKVSGQTTGEPKSKEPEICQRSFRYALRAIKLYRFLQGTKDGAAWVLGKQYLKAGTSIGANIQEAQSGESKSDFIHKYGIAKKEARESLYWLRLMSESGMVPRRRLQPLIKETEEVFAVVTAIILKAKGGEKAEPDEGESVGDSNAAHV
jgi:four helix bundle protein